ncbi:hypothetical protein [Variovorax arabinosiphilus]|uniref:hypothetical protein n=1 Tax=Variovorax arabinosiphilus TaxID=3053498 RepID=UPI002575FB67|nr:MULTISPECIES: hypothetical protein [unclassified Variovorax]MDM0122208.1 hypothetical protein [Variovorax sp. J2L1-78]MDM0131263.1 hypothetical protein [Variovorax sp. J2L1-63]MDM0234971.1 hypothetical protein [Variovorax sp. J2R1-6]
MTMREWKFADSPSAVVYTTRRVVERMDWIAYAFHDADDGAWQFHGSSTEAKESDAMVIRLESALDLDDSLSELADLPLGWRAWRKSKDSEWQRAPSEA